MSSFSVSSVIQDSFHIRQLSNYPTIQLSNYPTHHLYLQSFSLFTSCLHNPALRFTSNSDSSLLISGPSPGQRGDGCPTRGQVQRSLGETLGNVFAVRKFFDINLSIRLGCCRAARLPTIQHSRLHRPLRRRVSIVPILLLLGLG